MKKVDALLNRLQENTEKPWFPWALALLGFLDYIFIVFPMTSIVATSAVLNPKRWLRFALIPLIGSIPGALLFSLVLGHYGVTFLNWLAPSMMTSSFWMTAEHWIHQHGVWALFGLVLLPTSDQPPIAICSFAQMPFIQIALAVIFGKVIKFVFFGWLGSYAPETMSKLRRWNKVETETPSA